MVKLTLNANNVTSTQDTVTPDPMVNHDNIQNVIAVIQYERTSEWNFGIVAEIRATNHICSERNEGGGGGGQQMESTTDPT
jgi:hypothetical protein